MCGIIGEYSSKFDKEIFLKRRDSMLHRGPDAAGFFISEDQRVKLGHRRLSIIDLSQRASQPMRIGAYAIVYNGEVYNFKKLKKDLPGDYFSDSDTEVVLRAYIKYGPEAFKLFDGMFALAIYDEVKNQLILARDRMGIKPLYYSFHDGIFQFASELASLQINKKINLRAVRRFFYQNYIYGNESIIENVFKLPPASFAIFDLQKEQINIQEYWKPTFTNNYQDLNNSIDALRCVLDESIEQSLVSDVPLGVFLSSGVDSSLITAIAKEHVGNLNTFTVGFNFGENSYDESKNASKIAKIIGTNHNSIYLEKREVINAIPDIFDYFQEPFGDSSAIPTYFLCHFAKERATVCLSGDGGDELFGGYPIYYLPRISQIYRHLPIKTLVEKMVHYLPSSYRKMSFDYKLKRFVYAAKYPFTKSHFYYRIMHNADILVEDFFNNVCDDFAEYFKVVEGEDVLNQLLYVDQKTVLEGEYLVKVDRMSMANSLEVRVPFLNNEVIKFSNSLAPGLKIRGITTKYILKKLLERYLPKKLIYTKKQGFSFPIADWLKNELKDFMMDILDKKNIADIAFLNGKAIEKMVADHMGNKKDYSRELWGLISFVKFYRKNKLEL
ncbi:MAG: asparagine synthase (glutamine-hydrolyzing) [Patescibacteria group bacterium]|nr:asparagine synthase (glutamine-hydrolyzing) [Patescibacteria group bacterium]